MDLSELAELRQEYTYAGLDEADLAADPVEQFRRWFAAWHEVAVGDPNAMVASPREPPPVGAHGVAAGREQSD